MKKIFSIFGPTGIGKSNLAIKLAKKINGEIIGVDSRQIYDGISIGTAQPSKTQLNEIKRFLDNEGSTIVNIHFSDGTDTQNFKLKNLRNVDRKSISLLRNKEISINIH